jgi:uronate dehydrogenase
VKRIIFASSNHAVGFYPRTTTIATDVIPRPDSRYGLSKVFGEGLGALYAYKHGIGVTSLRIGNVADAPIDARRLAIWLAPEDLVRLIRIGLERPGIVYEVMYGVSDNARSWYDNSHAFALGYAPESRGEDHAEKVLAAEPKTGKHPVAEHYQGGTFCAAEYSADFETIKKNN